MVLGDLLHAKKNETRPSNYTTHQNKLKMDKRRKYKVCHHKSPRGKHRQENFREPTQKYFHQYIPNVSDIKERINKQEYIKLRVLNS